MKILVINGTHYFGRTIVELLLTRGEEITLCTHGNIHPPFWDWVETVALDRQDQDAFIAAFSHRHFDAVIDNKQLSERMSKMGRMSSVV